jgi:hypothetical protein
MALTALPHHATLEAALETCPLLGATGCGADMCNLGTTIHGADPQGPKTQIISKRA